MHSSAQGEEVPYDRISASVAILAQGNGLHWCRLPEATFALGQTLRLRVSDLRRGCGVPNSLCPPSASCWQVLMDFLHSVDDVLLALLRSLWRSLWLEQNSNLSALQKADSITLRTLSPIILVGTLYPSLLSHLMCSSILCRRPYCFRIFESDYQEGPTNCSPRHHPMCSSIRTCHCQAKPQPDYTKTALPYYQRILARLLDESLRPHPRCQETLAKKAKNLDRITR